MSEPKTSLVALAIAKALKERWRIGTCSIFCDDPSDFDGVTAEEVALVVDRAMSNCNQDKSLDGERLERLSAFLVSEVGTQKRVEQMDNRELLFWFNQSDLMANAPFGGFESALLDAIGNRLYPEYDGENVVMEEWGYSTPEGPIVYIKGEGP